MGRTKPLPPPRLVRHEVAVAGLDPRHDGVTIAHLSDIHVGHLTPAGHVRAAIELANSVAPDVVALTGDFVDGFVDDLLPELGASRLRLGSVDPHEVDERLIDLLARDRRLARHLHLPVQSGDDGVLRAMRRGHSVADLRELLPRLAAAAPGIHLGTDVIAEAHQGAPAHPEPLPSAPPGIVCSEQRPSGPWVSSASVARRPKDPARRRRRASPWATPRPPSPSPWPRARTSSASTCTPARASPIRA